MVVLVECQTDWASIGEVAYVNVIALPQRVHTLGVWHDVAIGPCECGAWHYMQDWENRVAACIWRRDQDETHYENFDVVAYVRAQETA